VLYLGVYKFNVANDDVSFNAGTPASLDNATYKINGQNVLLKNGLSVTEVAPGSGSKIITRYFGNEVNMTLMVMAGKTVLSLLLKKQEEVVSFIIL